VVEEGEPGSLTVLVVEATRTHRGHVIESSTDPVEGATVALDGPDGTRTEQTTGADGRVTFEELDWSLGTADVTVHKQDHIVHGVVGIDGSEEEIAVGLTLVDPSADWVTISGTAANMSDETHQLDMNTSCGVTSHQDVGPEWSMLVQPGVDFTLRAVEFQPGTDDPPRVTSQTFFSWVLLDHAAVTEDTTVDIDFAGSVTPVNVSNAIATPALRSDSPLMGTTFIYGLVHAGPVYVGFSEYAEPNSLGSAFDIDYEYIEDAGLPDPVTIYRLYPVDYFMGTSMVFVPGTPEEGSHRLGFLDLPAMEQTPTTTCSLHGTEFSWDLYDEGVEVSLQVWTTLDGFDRDPIAWRVDAPIDATSITVPDPPSSLEDESTLFETDLFRARVILARRPYGGRPTHVASGQDLLLQL
jgi:hypothetical protein